MCIYVYKHDKNTYTLKTIHLAGVTTIFQYYVPFVHDGQLNIIYSSNNIANIDVSYGRKIKTTTGTERSVQFPWLL